jgi:hypothetical protein
VWDLSIETLKGDQSKGWTAYRAERLTTLYPQLDAG